MQPACGVRPPEPYGTPHRAAMPDPSEELITILVEIHNGTRQARPSGRLRPLLVGRPHPKRKLRRWDGDGVVRSAARHLTHF
jgi:hypothetical protein